MVQADFRLSRQTAYDLAQARKGEDRIRVERYQQGQGSVSGGVVC